MSEHSPEEVHKQVKVYLKVFGALMVLTVVTVLVSYMHLGAALAVSVGLLIATVKGGMVASFFMHLKTERRWIYGVLILTAIFFLFLFVLPLTTIHDTFGEHIHYEVGGSHAEPGADPSDAHGAGH